MKNRKWGRQETTFWPRRAMMHTAGALVLCFVLCGGFGYLRFAAGLSELQRFYLPIFIRSAALSHVLENSNYSLLFVADQKGHSRVAIESDLEPGRTQASSASWVPFALSEQARSNGSVQLFFERKHPYRNDLLHAYLRYWIYQQRGLRDLFAPAFWGSLGIFGLALFYTVPQDLKRRRELRYGRRLRGPETLDPKEFDNRVHPNGLRFSITDKPGWIGIPRRLENSHILIVGDSGSGKSSLIRQVVLQIQDRGEGAILYDPGLEYITEFYSPERGDIILNPLDARMPFWNPSGELLHSSEAEAIAESLFPQEDFQNQFFVNSPRKIFAHLLKYRPTAEEIAAWMCDPKEIDRRVHGSELAAMLEAAAPAQRSGILGSLNMVGDALKCLPRKEEGRATWTAAEWAKTRQGFIFITSTPIFRTKLLPLMSLWLDMLVLRLMSDRREDARRVWFVLDELASLQRLPQLHTALTENRKCRNPLVLGFHGRSQLEESYGKKAEAMLSQPATKIFLRTTETGASDWISKMLGEVEIERLRESHQHGHHNSKNFSMEQRREPAVMASEISGLGDMRAFLKLENYITSFEFPYMELPKVADDFIPRKGTDEWLELPAALGDKVPVSNQQNHIPPQSPRPRQITK